MNGRLASKILPERPKHHGAKKTKMNIKNERKNKRERERAKVKRNKERI